MIVRLLRRIRGNQIENQKYELSRMVRERRRYIEKVLSIILLLEIWNWNGDWIKRIIQWIMPIPTSRMIRKRNNLSSRLSKMNRKRSFVLAAYCSDGMMIDLMIDFRCVEFCFFYMYLIEHLFFASSNSK